MDHRLARGLHKSEMLIPDPGNAGTITVDRSPCVCQLTSATAETRTLGRPTAVGAMVLLVHEVDAGDITLTVTGGYNENGDTSFTFSDPGQFLFLIAHSISGTFAWRVVSDYLVAQLLKAGGTINGALTVVGTTAIQGRMTTTDGVSSGTARVVGGLAYSNTAASTALVGNVNTEQLFDTAYTIPANTLKAGTVVRIRAQGIATTTQANDAVAYKLYIGGSSGTALISAASTDAANNDTFQAEVTLVCRTAGTTGTFVATGTYKVSSAEGTMTVKDDITASTTINTTANQVIALTATWNVANATNSCRIDILTVHID